jgi:transcriptional regulator with XRE-family HTH domain
MRTFTVQQAAAARAFLGWSRHELASASGLSSETVRDFEHDERSATTKSVDAIGAAFSAAGVDFFHLAGRAGTTIVVQCKRR